MSSLTPARDVSTPAILASAAPISAEAVNISGELFIHLRSSLVSNSFDCSVCVINITQVYEWENECDCFMPIRELDKIYSLSLILNLPCASPRYLAIFEVDHRKAVRNLVFSYVHFGFPCILFS